MLIRFKHLTFNTDDVFFCKKDYIKDHWTIIIKLKNGDHSNTFHIYYLTESECDTALDQLTHMMNDTQQFYEQYGQQTNQIDDADLPDESSEDTNPGSQKLQQTFDIMFDRIDRLEHEIATIKDNQSDHKSSLTVPSEPIQQFETTNQPFVSIKDVDLKPHIKAIIQEDLNVFNLYDLQNYMIQDLKHKTRLGNVGIYDVRMAMKPYNIDLKQVRKSVDKCVDPRNYYKY